MSTATDRHPAVVDADDAQPLHRRRQGVRAQPRADDLHLRFPDDLLGALRLRLRRPGAGRHGRDVPSVPSGGHDRLRNHQHRLPVARHLDLDRQARGRAQADPRDAVARDRPSSPRRSSRCFSCRSFRSRSSSRWASRCTESNFPRRPPRGSPSLGSSCSEPAPRPRWASRCPRCCATARRRRRSSRPSCWCCSSPRACSSCSRDLPWYLQRFAEFFPLKWLAQGMRSVFLPDSFEAAEVRGSWEHPAGAIVMAIWLIVGLVVAMRTFRWMRHDDN